MASTSSSPSLFDAPGPGRKEASASPPEPLRKGPTELGYRPGELLPYIDWTFYLQAMGLRGHYPGILDDRFEGGGAERLLDEARALLVRAEADRLLDIRGLVGFFPASSYGDDVAIWEDEDRVAERARIPFPRQAPGKEGRGACLADWIEAADSGRRDWIGAFAVTAGLGLEASLQAMKARNDGYDARLLGLLAERLVQAAAERMHEEVRRRLWAYAPDEELPPFRLFHNNFRGLRAVPGRGPCPDPRERRLIFRLLEVEAKLGMSLDEELSLLPAASLCGWYFGQPEARPFSVGRIDRAQALELAARRGEGLEETERWLRNELGYSPMPAGDSGTG